MKYDEMAMNNVKNGIHAVTSFVDGPNTYAISTPTASEDDTVEMTAYLRVYDIHDECTSEHEFCVTMDTDYAIDFNVISCFRNYLEEADKDEKMDLMEIIQSGNALEIDTTDPDGNPITLNVVPEL